MLETECPRAGPVKVNPQECQVVQARETARSQSLHSAEAGQLSCMFSYVSYFQIMTRSF